MRGLRRCACVALVIQFLLLAVALAAPPKILVLPLDGSADPAVRGRANAALQRLARRLPGDVTIGDATYGETATAVGCAPGQATCAATILTTLAVDELIYGTVSSSGGSTVIVLRRVKAGGAPQALRATLAPEDPPERMDVAVGTLLGVTVAEPTPARGGPTTGTGGATTGTGGATTGTGGATTGTGRAGTNAVTTGRRTGGDTGRATTGAATGAGSTGTPGGDALTGTATAPGTEAAPVTPAATYDNRTRIKGIVIASAGGVATLIGLGLWSSASNTQDAIDGAPTTTAADFARLEDLESSGQRKAMLGNVLVLGGLAVAGWGGWILYRDQQERRAVAVTPQVTPGGAALVIGGAW